MRISTDITSKIKGFVKCTAENGEEGVKSADQLISPQNGSNTVFNQTTTKALNSLKIHLGLPADQDVVKVHFSLSPAAYGDINALLKEYESSQNQDSGIESAK
ncbi:hypothetical protein ACTXT7_014321 [Hymenolepis weldensis]